MVYVARLDGPDLKTITRMVEDAIAVEKTGLQGLAADDARGIDGITGYGLGDASVRGAIDRLSAAGFPSKLDLKPESWTQPKGGIGDQAAGASFYVGWYNVLNFQNIFGQQGLARGAIAWHIASDEAQDIWDPNGKGWCVNLMRRGAAVTLGPVREPYVSAFPHGDVFVESLLSGATVAESYWLALPHISWAIVLLGDPLYRPFSTKPRPAVLARAYVAEKANGVLEKGETAPLLVQLECFGPPGSGTPALSAAVEPEMGLVEASGSVSIPALTQGETAVVRIPKVRAGEDPTGLFRLRLNIQNEGAQSRRIVLEGRIGFSRLTGTLGPKSLMFISPDGHSLLAGQLGNTVLVDTQTLESKRVTPSGGMGIASAEFSPDGSRIALSVFNPKEKTSAAVITDGQFANSRTLPASIQFRRWLDNDTVLLGAPGRLILYNLKTGEERVSMIPAGWNADLAPGTAIQVFTADDGRVEIKTQSGPAREVFRGVKGIRSSRIAGDLSVFLGLDSERRVWLQRGFDAEPGVIATGVDRVSWGPQSHRFAVQQPGRAKVFDVHDREWIDLGMASDFEWSADEQQLLFVQPGDGGSLRLLTGRTIEEICWVNRVGAVSRTVFSRDGQSAFLLAAITGTPDVWMMALHHPLPH
jgi:hypothetical protein